jgi:hypothetical protein
MRRAGLIGLILLTAACNRKSTLAPQADNQSKPAADMALDQAAKAPPAPEAYTNIFLHDVQLVEGPGITLTVSWLRGRIYPVQKGVIASLDKPQSFTLDVQDGLISIPLSHLAKALNTSVLKRSSLTDVKLSAQDEQLRIEGTLHKLVPLPVQILANLGISADGESVVLHIAKVTLLHVPVGGFLKAMNIKPAQLIDARKTKGVQVHNNDIVVDTAALLPPPRSTGKLTAVRLQKTGEMVEVFGTPKEEASKYRHYRNFVRLRGGTTQLGKLVMLNTDILVVDTSQNDVFVFDFAHFPQQLVNGFVRLTPQAGLQIYLPDISKIPATDVNRRIDVEWVKDRNIAPPPDLVR